MKKITILLSAFLCLILTANAQETFFKLYGEPHEIDCYSFAPTDDGGYIFACTNSDHNSDMYFFRTDINGDTLWTRQYDMNPYGYGWNYVFSIDTTSDGNFIIGAFEGNEGFLIKMNPDGDTLWTKMYEDIYSGWMHSVHEVPGGYIIGQQSPNQIMKTDENGELDWAHAYNTFGDFTLKSLFVGSDGYLVCGSVYDPENHTMNEDFYVMKTDFEGEMQWYYTEGETSDDVATDVMETHDNNIVAVGYRMEPTTSAWRGYIVKFNSYGDTLWTRTLINSPFILLNSVTETAQGDYVITGTISPARADALLLMKYDEDGNELWRQEFFSDHQPPYEFNVGEQVRIQDDGYIAVAGTCSKTNYSQAALLITNPDGIITSVSATKSSETESLAYPNPFSDDITIRFEHNKPVPLKLRIFNNLGQMQFESDQSLLQEENIFKWNGKNTKGNTVQSGLYYYIISNSENIISRGTLIKN